MSNHIVVIDTSLGADHVLNLVGGGDDKGGMLPRVGQILEAVDGGAYSGKVRVKVGGTQASGTITFASFVEDDTVTINGVVMTGKDAPSGDVQFETGVSDQSTANSLVSKVNASATAKLVGTVGATRRATVILSGFVEDDTVTVQGYVFTAKNSPTEGNKQQFTVGPSDAVTAENLMLAIKAHQSTNTITVTRSSATLTLNFYGSLTLTSSAHSTAASDIVVVTCVVPGTIGNLCTLAISANGSVSGAALTGGLEGTAYTYSKNRDLVV